MQLLYYTGAVPVSLSRLSSWRNKGGRERVGTTRLSSRKSDQGIISSFSSDRRRRHSLLEEPPEGARGGIMIEGGKDREEPVTLDGKKEFPPHSFLY